MSAEHPEPRRQQPYLNLSEDSFWVNIWEFIRILGNAIWKRFSLKVSESLKNLCCFFLLEMKRLPVDVDEDCLARISQTRDWKTAAFRYIDCHPSSPSLLMALVTREDTVLLYDESFKKRSCLRDLEQKHITCVAFRPWSQELAVGCSAGIFLWKSNWRSQVHRQIRHMQGTHHMRMLEDEGHTCVTSVQWNEDGTILASAALGSTHIILWEPDYQQKMRLILDPGNQSSFSLLRFSADFKEILCASLNGGASICELDRCTWRVRDKVQIESRIQTAVWTTCSSHLLFVKEGSTRLYSRTRNQEALLLKRPKPSWRIEMVANLQDASCSGEWRHCGKPLAIAMDPLGIYLAVIFKHQSFVLLCLLAPARDGPPRPIPIKFIACDGDDATEDEVHPTCMAWHAVVQSNIFEKIRLLVICWSTKHIQSYAVTSKSFEEAQRPQCKNYVNFG
nr:aladin [Drosophila kikkawai]